MAKSKQQAMNRFVYEIVTQTIALILIRQYVIMYYPDYNPSLTEFMLVGFVISIYRIDDFLCKRYFNRLDELNKTYNNEI